jgi:multicomponent Na+:H+ antiporter subunit D
MIPFSWLQLFPVIQMALLVLMALVGPLIPSKRVVKGMHLLGLILLTISAFIVLDYTHITGPFAFQMGGYERNFGIELLVDSFSAFFAFFVLFFVTLIHLFSMTSLNLDTPASQHTAYYSLLSLMYFSMIGILYSNDLFNMYVFIEILSLSACGIISVSRKKQNYMAAFRYLIMNTLASISVMFGIALIYMLTGSLNVSIIAERLIELYPRYPVNVSLSLGFIGVGLAIKSAIFPFHVWLPDAHSSANASASAILSGVIIKIYLLTLIKLLYRLFTLDVVMDLSIPVVMVVLAGVAMLMGSAFALGQKEIKRMLAYSTVSQVGYILLGFSIFTWGGLVAAFFYIVSHAFIKGLLFLTAGMAKSIHGIKSIKATEGIGYKIPLTMMLFTVGAMGMVGIPGTSGFMAKLQLSLAFLDVSRGYLVAILIISGVINALYFFPIIMNSFFQEESKEVFKLEKIPFAMGFTLLMFVGIIFALGLFPGLLLPYLEAAAMSLMGS